MSSSAITPAVATSPAIVAPAARRPMGRTIGMTLYILFLFVPIYWLLNISFKTNTDILSGLSLWPQHPTIENYSRIFIDSEWHASFVNSILYVMINTVVSVLVALPAAYAFSRYRFIGDKPLFFWLLSNLMAPPAVYAMPFFNLYSATGLFDSIWAVALAHCLFNVPLAVWILEGFISGVPARDRRDRDDRRLFLFALLHQDLPAADRQRDRGSRPSSASCSPGWSNCWPRR